MDPEQPDHVYTNGHTNGHSTIVDDEHHQPIEQSTVDKQNNDAVCK